jgi:transposase-like protein
MAVNTDGRREVLGMTIGNSEAEPDRIGLDRHRLRSGRCRGSPQAVATGR